MGTFSSGQSGGSTPGVTNPFDPTSPGKPIPMMPSVPTPAAAAVPAAPAAPSSILSPNQYGTPAGFNGVPGVASPTTPTSLNDIVNQQTDIANKFSQQIPGLSDSLYGQANRQAKTKLAGDIRDVNASYNSRGLLNSGRRGTAVAGAQGAATSGLNKTAGDINNALYNEQQSLYAAPVRTATAAALSPSLGASAAQPLMLDLASQMAQQQGQYDILGGIMQGLGSVGGSIAGSGGKSK